MTGRDDGMTLIELLISIVLLTVIMSAIVTAFILVLNTVDSTRQTVTDSTGAQLVTSWLVSDAQSADHVQPASGCVPAVAPLLELNWTDADNTTGVTDVKYVIEDAGNGNFQLSRYAYAVSGAGACTQSDQTVLVRAVDPGTTLQACAPAPACSDTSKQVALTVTALSKDPKTGNYSPYTFTVTGTRRTQ